MVRCDGGALLSCCCDQGASGQVICLPEDAPGALVDSGEGGWIKGSFLYSCDGQMMFDVVFHVLAINPFQMATGHDTGGQGTGGWSGSTKASRKVFFLLICFCRREPKGIRLGDKRFWLKWRS